MKTYGQFCPVAKAAELFCERWTPLIIRDLAAGATRFSELQRGVPLMSPTLLSRRLRQLEDEGIVQRQPATTAAGRAGGAGRWTYHLTPAGAEFVPLVIGLGTWGQRWARRQLMEHEIDLGLLIWSLERSVNVTAFGADRTVVRLDFTDQPARQKRWWFLNDGDRCQVCLDDPGFQVALYLACTLPDMIYIIRGDLPLSHATETGRLDAHGSAQARRALRDWLNLSDLSKIESQRRNETNIDDISERGKNKTVRAKHARRGA